MDEKKVKKVIEIKIDMEQGAERIEKLVEPFADFVLFLFELLGLEIFFNSYNEHYGDEEDG